MTYRIEITAIDADFIKACVMGVVRRAQQSTMSEEAKIKVTTEAAGVVTRFNAALMSTHDVMFINVCIQKTKDYLLTDNVLPAGQREAAIQLASEVQNKLAGVGKPRHEFNA